MAARTWPAGEAGPLGAQAGHCLCSKQGQPVTVGEGGRGPWVRHFQLISHSHSGCVLPTWELGAGSQVLGPRHWAGHRCGIILSPFPVSHFRLFLNKGLSSLKEHLLTWAGPHLQPGSTGTWPSGVEGRGVLATWQRALLLPRGGHRGFFHKEEQRSSRPALSTRGPHREAASEVRSHTTESRITEPRRTRGRGHTGDTSTKLSWTLSGLFSDSVKMRVPGVLSNRAW